MQNFDNQQQQQQQNILRGCSTKFGNDFEPDGVDVDSGKSKKQPLLFSLFDMRQFKQQQQQQQQQQQKHQPKNAKRQSEYNEIDDAVSKFLELSKLSQRTSSVRKHQMEHNTEQQPLLMSQQQQQQQCSSKQQKQPQHSNISEQKHPNRKENELLPKRPTIDNQKQPQRPQQQQVQHHQQPNKSKDMLPPSVMLSFDGEEGIDVYKNRLRLMNNLYQQDREFFQAPPNRTVVHDIPKYGATRDTNFTRAQPPPPPSASSSLSSSTTTSATTTTSKYNNNLNNDNNYKLFFDDDIDSLQQQQKKTSPLLRLNQQLQKSRNFRSSSPDSHRDYVSCSLLANWKKDKKFFSSMATTETAATSTTTTLLSMNTITSSPQIKLTQLITADAKQRSSSADSVKKLVAKLAQLRPGRKFWNTSTSSNKKSVNNNNDNGKSSNLNKENDSSSNRYSDTSNSADPVAASSVNNPKATSSLSSLSKDQKPNHHLLLQNKHHPHHHHHHHYHHHNHQHDQLLLHHNHHQLLQQVKLATLPTTTNQLKRYMESQKDQTGKEDDDYDLINNSLKTLNNNVTQSSLTLNNMTPWELPPNYVDMIFSKELDKSPKKVVTVAVAADQTKVEFPDSAINKVGHGFSMPPTPTVATKPTK
ncbi:hypothetical protein HELRODRAFT_190151 [Helobdella robusta]|uniref:Uncharacterized protein n=1 Tax=Helobdella robusta TaxID=6412 RepID=T1FRQ8_HELRO|nr:hypothetical protein HELRODRAFT_190151 [Helobdella robusta]ESO10736.1 hypothetical protein HELRODRAFT_190151 [Helobdella robusta]